jgi:uncharacterized membrane protein YidH (DUF202 family)
MEEIIEMPAPDQPGDKPEKKKKKELKDEFSLDRMELALYRAQMAMVRTTTTMTTVGFAIYKLLKEKLEKGEESLALKIATPKTIAITLFFAGFLGLTTYSIRHMRSLKKIGRFTKAKLFSGVMLMSYILFLLTLMLLIGTLTSGSAN